MISNGPSPFFFKDNDLISAPELTILPGSFRAKERFPRPGMNALLYPLASEVIDPTVEITRVNLVSVAPKLLPGIFLRRLSSTDFRPVSVCADQIFTLRSIIPTISIFLDLNAVLNSFGRAKFQRCFFWRVSQWNSFHYPISAWVQPKVKFFLMVRFHPSSHLVLWK